MKIDPHLGGVSTEAFAYNTREEDFFSSLNNGLKTMPLPSFAPREDLPLIYIVGSPRSGTTLLSQLVSRHLDVGYVSNLMARFWARPSVGISLSRAILGANPDAAPAFESLHGRTADPAGPHEFGYFWRYWLGLDECRTHHLTIDDLAKVNIQGLRSAFQSEILGTCRTPFVFKTVVAGFCARFLTKVHKKSLFIYIYRDKIDVARSILRCRMERYSDYSTWWSLIPAAWPFVCDNPGEEVALQVEHCCREIEEELSAPEVSHLRVSYEDLCQQPDLVLERIQESLRPWGHVPQLVRRDFSKFEVRHEPALDTDLEGGLKKIFDTVQA